jgi:hypothetical protein
LPDPQHIILLARTTKKSEKDKSEEQMIKKVNKRKLRSATEEKIKQRIKTNRVSRRRRS